jgi:hypothetical protein
MSEVKTSISYEDLTAYQDGVRVGIEKGRNFERSEILQSLSKIKDQPEIQKIIQEIGKR